MSYFDTDVQVIRNKVLGQIIQLAYAGNLTPTSVLAIPKEIIPDGSKPTMRCCIYKERAILAERVGVTLQSDRSPNGIVQVMPIACDECPADGIKVTETCRGCLAHRCMKACPKGAISFNEENRRAVIDKSKCVECGRCINACSYHAIVEQIRPCMNACKSGALSINYETRKVQIDYHKCLACGQCVYRCPFGAMVDKSHVVDIINLIHNSENNTKYRVYAIVAPSVSAQYDTVPGITTEKVISGILKLGFGTVVEAAWGADVVAYREAKELVEKGLLFSSCCPAFVKYVRTAFPDLAEHISHNLSPMATMAQILKRMDPNCKCVFIGPCIAKKSEVGGDAGQYVDAVMTFEGLQAFFEAMNIDLETLEDTPLANASYFGRVFARSGGLCEAITEALREQGVTQERFTFKPVICNGLDECKAALLKAQHGVLDGNFIEGMCCENGCIGGPACVAHAPRDKAEVNKYGRSSEERTIKSAISDLRAYVGA